MKAAAVILKWLGCTGKTGEEVFYIGGGESLPAPFSPQEERMWLEKHAKGSAQARSMLIEHNLRLVVNIAKRFENTPVTLEDLISIGTIGLIKAVNTYNMDRKIKLATYASRCIENEILMFLRRSSRSRCEVSFDEPLNVDWDGNELLLSDVLGTEADVVNRGIEQETEKQLLREALTLLTKREREIMEMRFGLAGKKELTQKEVAERLGISQSYISRLEKRIIKRLRRDIGRLVE